MDKLEISHLLDYGCGSNVSLAKGFQDIGYSRKFSYQCYDPGVKEFSDPPEPAELVTCIDVLEHIEPEYLDDVLDHLESLAEVCLFASVHTGPAGKVLSDGRNAHLIQQPPQWWLPKFFERFHVQTFQVESPAEFWVICNNAALDIDA